MFEVLKLCTQTPQAVRAFVPYSPAYRRPLFSFFKCKYWVDKPYYPPLHNYVLMKALPRVNLSFPHNYIGVVQFVNQYLHLKNEKGGAYMRGNGVSGAPSCVFFFLTIIATVWQYPPLLLLLSAIFMFVCVCVYHSSHKTDTNFMKQMCFIIKLNKKWYSVFQR